MNAYRTLLLVMIASYLVCCGELVSGQQTTIRSQTATTPAVAYGSGGSSLVSQQTTPSQDATAPIVSTVNSRGGYGQTTPSLAGQQAVNAYPGYGAFGGSLRSASGSVRFLTFNPISAEARQSIAEDTAVLQHLIGRSVPNQSARNALGVTLWQASASSEAFYVEGSGLFVVMNVSQPVAPLNDGESKEPTEPEKISAWDQAKKELAQQSSPETTLTRTVTALAGGSAVGYGVAESGVYDAEFAENLNSTVSAALQQAGNFRALEKSDSICVIANGLGGGPGERTVYAWRVKMSDVGEDNTIPESRIESKQYIKSLGVEIGATLNFVPKTIPN